MNLNDIFEQPLLQPTEKNPGSKIQSQETLL